MKVLTGAVGALAVLLIACTGAHSGEPKVEYVQRLRKVNYRVDLDPGETGKVTVELHAHLGEGKWKKLAEVKRDVKEAVGGALTGDFSVERRAEGTYEFAFCSADERGNRDREIDARTAPELRYVVDGTPPWIIAKRLTPMSGAADAAKVQFAWATRDANIDRRKDRPVELQARLKQEKDWQTIKTGLPAVGRSAFPELAAVAARLTQGTVEVRFRATDRAGNVGEDLAGKVVVDRMPPRGKVTGPVMASSLDVEVFYEVADRGPAGLADVALWVSSDGGQSWSRCREEVPHQSGTVRIKLARAGKYGLYLSAVDAVGNALGTPEPGTRPQVVLLTDTAAPRLTFAGGHMLLSDRKRFADGALELKQREDLLEALKGYPLEKGFNDWRARNAKLWQGILKDHDANGDGRLAGDEIRTLRSVLKDPCSLSSFESMDGLFLAQQQKLILKWKLVDENLSKAPVSIEFSSNGGESWSMVANGLANDRQATGNMTVDRSDAVLRTYTGSYWWQPPKVDSTRCLLRLTARDLVGHKTSFVSRPFSVDNRAPRSSAVSTPAGEPAGKAVQRRSAPEPDRSGELSRKARSWLRRKNADLSNAELIAKAVDLHRAGENTHALVAAAAAFKSSPKTDAAQRARVHLVLCRALMVDGGDDLLERLRLAGGVAADASKLAPLRARLEKKLGRRLRRRLEARAAELLRLQASAHLAEAIRLDRGGTELAEFHRELLKLARDQIRQRLPRGAGESAALALMIVPDSVEGHMLRGRALVGVDDEQALAHLERAVKLAPSSDEVDADLAAASFNVGKKRAEQGKRRTAERLLVQAVDRYGRVAARRNRSAASQYNLAQALVFLSRVEDDGAASRARAESHFRKALNVGRRSPNVYANACYWLGTLREQAKDWPMASRYWQSAARVYGPGTQLGKLAQARAERTRGRR